MRIARRRTLLKGRGLAYARQCRDLIKTDHPMAECTICGAGVKTGLWRSQQHAYTICRICLAHTVVALRQERGARFGLRPFELPPLTWYGRPTTPTTARPGTREKLQVLAQRAARMEALFAADDPVCA